jgi:hypothetical protein
VERGQSRCPADAVRLPTDIGPPTGRTRLAVLGVDRYGGGSGASRSKGRSTRLPPDPDFGAHRRWPCRHGNRCVRSRALLHPASQSAVRQWRLGQVRVWRGVAARLRLCGHAGWDPALRFGAGFGGYSSDTGNKPQPSAGPSPRPACVEVARQPVRSVPPLHSMFGVRSHSWQGFRSLRVGVLSDSAHAHDHPARVIKPGRH